jgi:hypothetical protein
VMVRRQNEATIYHVEVSGEAVPCYHAKMAGRGGECEPR